jgi:long-subunit fatty acid transport protein
MAIVSQVNLDYKDDLRFKNLHETILGEPFEASGPLNSRLKININLPAQLAVGACHGFTHKLALVGTVNWQK